jgi:hypothetical protein
MVFNCKFVSGYDTGHRYGSENVKFSTVGAQMDPFNFKLISKKYPLQVKKSPFLLGAVFCLFACVGSGVSTQGLMLR